MEQALRDYDAAIERNPGKTNAYRANVFVRNGEFDRALQDYDKALQLDPKFHVSLGGRGRARFYQAAYTPTILPPIWRSSPTIPAQCCGCIWRACVPVRRRASGCAKTQPGSTAAIGRGRSLPSFWLMAMRRPSSPMFAAAPRTIKSPGNA